MNALTEAVDRIVDALAATNRCTCNADPADIAEMGHLDDCPQWQPVTHEGDGIYFGQEECGCPDAWTDIR